MGDRDPVSLIQRKIIHRKWIFNHSLTQKNDFYIGEKTKFNLTLKRIKANKRKTAVENANKIWTMKLHRYFWGSEPVGKMLAKSERDARVTHKTLRGITHMQQTIKGYAQQHKLYFDVTSWTCTYYIQIFCLYVICRLVYQISLLLVLIT